MRGKTQKYTSKEVRDKLLIYGYALLSNYVNYKTQIIIKDNEGYLYNTRFGNIINGHSPFKFNVDNKYTIRNLEMFIRKNYVGYILLNYIYYGKDIKLDLIDNQGYMYQICISSLQSRHELQKFHPQNKYSINNIKLWLKYNNKEYIILSTKYLGLKNKLLWKCLSEKCGEEFLMPFSDIAFNNCNCSYCSGHSAGLSNCLALKDQKLAKTWHPYKNDISPYEITLGSSSYQIWWMCPECGYEWQSTVINRRKIKQCPNCSKSHGETKIYNYLVENNINFSQEFSLDDLLSNKGYKLRFDFAIFYDIEKTILLTLIEYDGEGHFSDNPFGKKSYDQIIEHDRLKNKYCEKHNISLIRIPYWDFENIEQILDKNKIIVNRKAVVKLY